MRERGRNDATEILGLATAKAEWPTPERRAVGAAGWWAESVWDTSRAQESSLVADVNGEAVSLQVVFKAESG